MAQIESLAAGKSLLPVLSSATSTGVSRLAAGQVNGEVCTKTFTTFLVVLQRMTAWCKREQGLSHRQGTAQASSSINLPRLPAGLSSMTAAMSLSSPVDVAFAARATESVGATILPIELGAVAPVSLSCSQSWYMPASAKMLRDCESLLQCSCQH